MTWKDVAERVSATDAIRTKDQQSSRKVIEVMKSSSQRMEFTSSIVRDLAIDKFAFQNTFKCQQTHQDTKTNQDRWIEADEAENVCEGEGVGVPPRS